MVESHPWEDWALWNIFLSVQDTKRNIKHSGTARFYFQGNNSFSCTVEQNAIYNQKSF